jgi:hypothetical protein
MISLRRFFAARRRLLISLRRHHSPLLHSKTCRLEMVRAIPEILAVVFIHIVCNAIEGVLLVKMSNVR